MYSTKNRLAGRQEIVAKVRGLLSAARTGSSQCVVVEGTTGLGKSRLLQEVTDEARLLGMTTVNCRATELDRVAPLSTLLPGLRRGGLPGIDAGTLGGHGNDCFWLIDRIREIIETHVRDRPLYIAVDDAQWADELTLMVIRTLVPELATAPVFWMLALNPCIPLCPAVGTIDRLMTEDAHRIELGPLDDGAVAELCAEALGAFPDQAALRLASRASGNPFLLRLLFGALRDSGRLAVVEGAGTYLPGDLPAGLFDAVMLRLQDLSADARALLDVGALLNRPFTVHEAACLLSRGTVELLPIAKETVQAGILVADGAELWFNHDLIREAIYRNLYEPIKIALCREAATLMITVREQNSEQERAAQASHLKYGQDRATGSAVPERAGVEAALRAGIAGVQSRLSGNVAKGATAYDEGNLDTAISCARAAAAEAEATGDDAVSCHPRLWLSRALAAADRFEEAEAGYSWIRSRQSLPENAWLTPSCYYFTAELRLAQGLLAEAASEAEKGLESAERLKAPQLSMRSLALMLEVAVHQGDLNAAERYAKRLEPAADGGPLGLLWPLALYQDAAGEQDLALKTATPLIEALPGSLPLAAVPAAGLALLKLAQRAGAGAFAAAIVTALRQISGQNPAVPSLAGAAQHAAGLRQADLDALQTALRYYTASPRPLVRAVALEDTARAEREAGHWRCAAEHIEEALRLYANAGAQRHVTAVQKFLRESAQREAQPGSSASPCPKLTQSELPVAQLVIEGLTNREIATRLYLSPHTVDSHLRHIFSKFGVNNRVELTRRFAPRQEAQAGVVLAGR